MKHKYVPYVDRLKLNNEWRERWRIQNQMTNRRYWFKVNDQEKLELVYAPLEWRPPN